VWTGAAESAGARLGRIEGEKERDREAGRPHARVVEDNVLNDRQRRCKTLPHEFVLKSWEPGVNGALGHGSLMQVPQPTNIETELYFQENRILPHSQHHVRAIHKRLFPVVFTPGGAGVVTQFLPPVDWASWRFVGTVQPNDTVFQKRKSVGLGNLDDSQKLVAVIIKNAGRPPWK